MSKYWKEVTERKVEHCKQVGRYAENFLQNNALAKQAQTDGWTQDLEHFVYRTADTMQQMLDDKKGFGWTSSAVPDEYVIVYRELLRKARPEIKASGLIDVMLAMPDMAPAYWKVQAAKAPGKAATKFEQHCDKIMERLKNEREKKTNN